MNIPLGFCRFILAVFLLASVIFSPIVSAASTLVYSSLADRSNQLQLGGAVVSDDIFVFVPQTGNVSSVTFFLNNVQTMVEGKSPFDFTGTASNGSANPFPTTGLCNGEHEISALVGLTDGTQEQLDAVFTTNNSNTSSCANNPPVAIFSVNCIELFCTFDATSSNDNGSIVEYSWNFGDGQTATQSNAVTAHTYSSVGDYTVSLSVIDDEGFADTSEDEITVQILAANMLYSLTSDRGSPLDLDGAVIGNDFFVFVVPSSEISRVDFFIDDSEMLGAPYRIERKAPFDLEGGSNASAKVKDISTLTSGVHIITAKVFFKDGVEQVIEASFVVDINVDPNAPVSEFSFNCAELACTFDASSSSDDLGIVQYAWDFGDGQSTTTTSNTVSHLYNESGSYVVELLVIDSDGLTDSSTTTIQVIEAATFEIVYSTEPDRSNPVILEQASLADLVYIHVIPQTGISRVDFYVDDPLISSPPYRVETKAPFDLEGGGKFSAGATNTASLQNGAHNVTAVISLSDGSSQTISADFLVDNVGSQPTAAFGFSCVNLVCDFDASASFDDGSILEYQWDFGDSQSTNVNSALTTHIYSEPGIYTVTLTVVDNDGQAGSTINEIEIFDNEVISQKIRVSTSFDRSNSIELDGTTVSGDIYVFVAPTAEVNDVLFFLNDPDMVGLPYREETKAPFDMEGGTPVSAGAFNSSNLINGANNISALVIMNSGQNISLSADFQVDNVVGGNLAPTALFTHSCNDLICEYNATSSFDTDGNIVNYSWDFGDGNSEVSTSMIVSHVYADEDSYTVSLTVTDDFGATDTFASPVSTISNVCSIISILPCDSIRLVGNQQFQFDSDAGGLVDKNGIGTGFTMVAPPSVSGNPIPNPNAPGYWPSRIEVDSVSGRLKIQTTAGLQFKDINNLDNALGVGLNLPSAPIALETTIVGLAGTPNGGSAQAGLWFGRAQNFGRGTSEDDYIKAVVISTSIGVYKIEALLEQNGLVVAKNALTLPSGTSSVALKIVINPVNRSADVRYSIGGVETVLQSFFSLPDEWFSFDQAGIDPSLATRSFGGIFASHRNQTEPIIFEFDNFNIEENTDTSGSGDFQFDRWSIPVSFPTAMDWGPDQKLYVADVFGSIHIFTLDLQNKAVLNQQTIDTLISANGETRLTLGLEIDPSSTAQNIILWLAHADGSQNNGDENSAKISRLSGAGLTTLEDRITGLPRAIANHSVNNIEFGPDGKLYINVGGNTGAGAANLGVSEFGDRPEQPLSAAILVADVNNPDFEGVCATPIGSFGIPNTCDVTTYATGLRNSYDSAWHSSGNLYATDNGLGVLGTVPPVASPDCTGFADPILDYPGGQTDLLLKIEPGKYYGHPNPYRNECVFKDGSFQGVGALSNYENPLLDLGNNRSANGIIEYRGDAFFGSLRRELLITNFSVGDNITRVRLSMDGENVVSTGPIVSGFTDPLPIAQDDDGNLYVGEFNGNQVTVLAPQPLSPAPTGQWGNKSSLPEARTDSGSAVVNGLLYVVAGKSDSAHLSSMFTYDPIIDTWSSQPPLPSPGVENPSVVSLDGKLYVFGGSTAPFSGARGDAYVYDPEFANWTTLSSMPTARAGASAEAINGLIYVSGGLAANGSSLDTVEVYNPATNTWSTGTSMTVRRDNAGSMVINGNLYVVGGRTRNSDGSVVNDSLNSIEILNPGSGAWSAGPPMLTPRRSMMIGSAGGRFQVIGGESPASSANEEFDPDSNSWRVVSSIPIARHGAAVGTIEGIVYVAGGDNSAGNVINSTVEFTY